MIFVPTKEYDVGSQVIPLNIVDPSIFLVVVR
jgi:hypothetical protein